MAVEEEREGENLPARTGPAAVRPYALSAACSRHLLRTSLAGLHSSLSNPPSGCPEHPPPSLSSLAVDTNRGKRALRAGAAGQTASGVLGLILSSGWLKRSKPPRVLGSQVSGCLCERSVGDRRLRLGPQCVERELL